ncbi:hypothetical protein [Rhodanobacter sp. UC4451_H18]
MGTKSNTGVLQEAFHGRVALSPKEIARVLHGKGKDTKKRVETVRAAPDTGTLISGLRKDGARWRVPIAALGAAMDARVGLVRPDGSPDMPSQRRKAHSTIGPRMLSQRQRSAMVWRQILVEVDELRARDVQADMQKKIGSAPEATGSFIRY